MCVFMLIFKSGYVRLSKDLVCAPTTRVRGITHIAYLLGVGKVMGSMLGPNHVIAKDFKSCTYY